VWPGYVDGIVEIEARPWSIERALLDEQEMGEDDDTNEA
jgi:hypothetical protein